MRYLFIITTAVVLYSISSYASCADIVSEVKAMKEAQTAIQASLISNHAMFASALESYSEAVSEAHTSQNKLIAAHMMSSAESFKSRGLKAQKTSVKLEDATDDLIQRLSKCLK